MKVSKKALIAHNDVIKVDDYRLVAALRLLGFDMPRRHVAFRSEQVNKKFWEEVIADSVYLYPHTEELEDTLESIESMGLTLPSFHWKDAMDELKLFYGVGPSKIKSHREIREFSQLGKKPIHVYEVGR